MKVDHEALRVVLQKCNRQIGPELTQQLLHHLLRGREQIEISAWDGVVPANRIAGLYAGRLQQLTKKGLLESYKGLPELVHKLKSLEPADDVRGVTVNDLKHGDSIAVCFCNPQLTKMHGFILFPRTGSL